MKNLIEFFLFYYGELFFLIILEINLVKFCMAK